MSGPKHVRESGNRLRHEDMRRTEDLKTDRLFSQIDFSGGALVAVSGGSDSTALLLLLKQYLYKAFPAARLLAVTVDHALRPGSSAEAEAVGSLCARHGISHRTVRWDGPKPAAGLPAAARCARYRLLAQAACAAGIGMILTGHTADDQAETVLMRRARMAGPDPDGHGPDDHGLAGMAPATLYDGAVWIVRPLLATRRAALRDWLAARGEGWTEDPTNENLSFERPRMRAFLDGDGHAGFVQALAVAARAAETRIDLGRHAAALIGTHAARPAAGLLRLDRAFLQEPDRQAAVHALRILIAAAGGARFLPERARAASLLARLAGHPGRAPLRATLSHAVVDARAAGLFLHRERRGLLAAAMATDGAIWDGRYRIRLHGGAGCMVEAAGASAAVAPMPEAGNAPASLVRAARAAEPVLSATEPAIHGEDAAAVPVVAPFARFLSCFDLAPARAVAAIVGADAVPPPPFAGRIGPASWAKA